ncbi:hypothetical protein ACSSS7_001492 [Eimeria intestinalis]
MEKPQGSIMPSKVGRGDPQRNILEGRLAWMPCSELGFVTVKVLSVDVSKGVAFVEKHPEGEASVAAAQAAAEVIFGGSTAHSLADASASRSTETRQPTECQDDTSSPCKPQPSTEDGNAEGADTSVVARLLPPRSTAKMIPSPFDFTAGENKEACSDWYEGRSLSGTPFGAPHKPHLSFCQHENNSSAADAQAKEATANAAAAAAAARVFAAFVAAPPVTVLPPRLWPYSRPPMPPHQVPDDSASCISLSAPALLQQLQHRYLRNEIYTYAAHVLLAVNPCKPLPHLYSAQQIVLYKHWRGIARAYRRQISSEESQERPVPRREDSSRPNNAIEAILSRLPGVMPIAWLPETAALSNGPASGPKERDSPALDPCLKDSCFHEPLYRDDVPAAALTTAPAGVEQTLKESAGRANRPPPHPFVIAEEAHRRLVGTQTNQTIVVSGQSGAGKTETSKQLMLFLTHVSVGQEDTPGLNPDEATEVQPSRDVPLNVSEQRRQLAALTGGVQTLREAAELRNQIVSCNAIFESFGNAATRRNHNSSRIGRLTLLHFDGGGLLRGGSLRTYMLEAARLTAHKKGDRNFHVFYQLLRGASEEERAALHLLRDTEAYRMLQPQQSLDSLQAHFLRGKKQDADLLGKNAQFQATAEVPLAVDQENFFALTEALTRADFPPKEIDELLRLLAGLLHLSNISFCEDNGGLSELQDADAEDALTWAANLLGLKENELKDLLRCRRVRLKGDLFFTWRSRQQSYSACCSVIKFIYNRIFDQIVQRLNKGFVRHMEPQQRKNQEEGPRHKSVGILDIYGFECFGLENGLEQLCINYANEKQQQLFVQRVIEEEIALYTREGIAKSSLTARQKRQKRQEQQPPGPQCSMKKELHASFKASLEQSLFSSLPDTSVLLLDLQEGVFRRLDDSCRLLAQGQQRDDLHFWKDLFAYCGSSRKHIQVDKGPELFQQKRAEQYLFFCLKGTHGVKAADAAANGHLLQQLQLDDLNSIGLVAADQLVVGRPRDAAGANAAGKAASGKVQERVFAVKHFAGTVVYRTDGWLELNNDRIEYELERLVAKSDNSLLRQAMMQHEASREQEGTSVITAGGGQFSSITKRFVKSVKDLSQELQGPQMQLHFIRCFTPNRYLRPDNFERNVVLQQLRLREQEQTLEQLFTSRAQLHHPAPDSTMPQDEIEKHTRMLQMLRHCNPANIRDQTLGGVTTMQAEGKRGKQPRAKNGRKLSPPMRFESTRKENEDKLSFYEGYQSWNAFLFPLNLQSMKMTFFGHHAAVHFGSILYFFTFHGKSSQEGGHLTLAPPASQPPLHVQQLLDAEFCAPKIRSGQQPNESSDGAVRGGESTAPKHGESASSAEVHIVSVAKHPSYTNLFLACTSTAQLLLFDTVDPRESLNGKEEETQEEAEALIEDFLALTGVPSTALPPLNTASARLTEEAAVLSEYSTCKASTQTAERRSRPQPSLQSLPPLPAHLSHCAARPDNRFPPRFLRKAPIQPSKWLPKDLLQLLASESQQNQHSQRFTSPRASIVCPLRISFAHPNTAHYALVLCLLQGESSSGRDPIEKLVLVLVNMITQCSAGWLPVAFSVGAFQLCTRRHSSHLRHLTRHSSTETSSSKNGAKSSGAKQRQQLNARTLSNLLSSVQLKPLWGDKWAVVGPALLALFAVNLGSLEHPPGDNREQDVAHKQPLVLLWNLASVPSLKGPSLEVARVWFEACTYIRISPPGLRHASGSGPLVQFTQMMPHGPVARSLDARIKRLVLLSTADNKLSLMQWTDRPSCCGATNAGELVLLDQIQLPYSVLQFLREAPAEDSAHEGRSTRLMRAFPWEADALMPRGASKQAPTFQNACNEEFVDSDACTTSGSSDVGSGGLRNNPQLSVRSDEEVADLKLGFPSYGIAIVKRTCTGSITRSLTEETHPTRDRDSQQHEGHVVAVTALPSCPGVLASIWRLPHGALRLCLGDERGNWRAVGDLELQQ